jgi:DedD protein
MPAQMLPSRPVSERLAKSAVAISSVGPSTAAAGNGWMIQLGSFASRANAERLSKELKGKGFKASVLESTGGGRKLYRVRVGPAADRAAAMELVTRLRAAGQTGSIVPHS